MDSPDFSRSAGQSGLLLTQHLNQRGDETALVDFVSRPITWRELAFRVIATVRALQTLPPSCPVAHLSDNQSGDVIMALACAVAGRLEAPLDHRLSQTEIGQAEINRRLKILGTDLAGEAIKRNCIEPSDHQTWPASGSESWITDRPLSTDSPSGIILWTSGTTSDPLGVHLSHQSWLGNAIAKLGAAPQTAADVRLTVLPLCHAYARTCDLATWLITGGTLALSLGYDLMRKQAAIVKPTLMNCVPAIADRLLEDDVSHDGSFHRLRMLGVGGAALSIDSFAAWKRRGVAVIQGYGQTETGPVICSATAGNATAGLVGDFVDGWQHQVRDGQLWVRGKHLMQGYWNNPDATAEKFDADGWLRTGDLVERDPESGQIRILGRSDEVIVLPSGNKVYPSSVEREVNRCPGVRYSLLVWRNGLELWIDAAREVDLRPIRQTLASERKLGQVAIKRFALPLSAVEGHLTAKGTIRRWRILQELGNP